MPQSLKQPAEFMQRAESVGNPQGPLPPPIVLQLQGPWRTGQQQGWRVLLSSEPWRGDTWAATRARKGPAGRRTGENSCWLLAGPGRTAGSSAWASRTRW